MEDLAGYLARRYRVLYPDLVGALRARGIRLLCVRWWQGPPRAYFLRGWVIFAEPGVTREELAHELGECWVRENTALGIEYPPWEWKQETPHETACRFAEEITL